MNILDTTIRDGSYAVDFKFSCKDVQDLVSKSKKIGIKYIEIGHGMGLNASSMEHGYSLHTDLEYMTAAKAAAGDARLGFFCIPGIARLEDIEAAKENGMAFIRIGINISDYEKAIPYIDKVCREDMEVFVNFMKSYTVKPREFADYSKDVYERGGHGIYIVDSAGCMNRQDIEGYIDAVRENSKIQIGFHGHNNLGLAVENTVYCVEKGVDFIDCSFQGLGRSLGNASLEQVIMVLDKMGYEHDFDIPKVLEYGYAGLRNIVSGKLTNPLDYMCGYAGFHSGFIKDIYRCANEKMVDPLRLILAYSRINKTNMDYNELCRAADTLSRDPEDNPYNFGEYFSEKYIDG